MIEIVETIYRFTEQLLRARDLNATRDAVILALRDLRIPYQSINVLLRLKNGGFSPVVVYGRHIHAVEPGGADPLLIEVARIRRPVRRAGPISSVCLPLLSDEGLLGVFSVETGGPPHDDSHVERLLLVALALGYAEALQDRQEEL